MAIRGPYWRKPGRAKLLAGIVLSLFLAACGGRSRTYNLDTPHGVTRVRAVAPYVVGAVFQDVAKDGGGLLQTSTPTDAEGLCRFPKPLVPGSIIQMVPGHTGTRGREPFSGVLKRKVGAGDKGIVVVSPLTTLVANGASPREVIRSLRLAGLPGITTTEIAADPLAGLQNLKGDITEEQLKLLQASMAVNAYMSAINDNPGAYDLRLQSLEEPAYDALFGQFVSASRMLLDPALYRRLVKKDRGHGSDPATMDDFVDTAAQIFRTIAAGVNANLMARGVHDMSPNLVQNILARQLPRAAAIMQAYCARGTASRPVGHPGDPPHRPATLPDGSALYASDCANCHGALASSSKAGATTAQIRVAIDGNMGGMGAFSTLTPSQVQSIARALGAGSGPRTGSLSHRPAS